MARRPKQYAELTEQQPPSSGFTVDACPAVCGHQLLSTVAAWATALD